MKIKSKIALALSPIMLAFSGLGYAGTCTGPCIVEASSFPEIQLRDTTAGEDSWEIENTGGVNSHFQIGLNGGTSEPFKIKDTATANTVYISGGGLVGINTSAPSEELTINSARPAIRLNDTTAGAFDFNLVADGSNFALEDAAGNNIIFVEGNTTSTPLYLDSDGDVGIQVSNPVTDLHVGGSGDMLLENGVNDWGFNTGNGGLFFRVGDNTPFGTAVLQLYNDAPGNSIVARTAGVGIGTSTPTASLHVRKTDGSTKLLVEEASATTAVRNVVRLRNNGGVGFQLEDSSNTNKWEFRTGGSGAFLISDVNVGGAKMLMNSTGLVKMGKNVAAASNAWNLELDADGDLHIAGNMFVSGTQLTVPDYVFADDYKLMPLDELQSFVQKEKHLPNIASEAEVIKAKTVNVGKSQMRHLEKIEELTLYTIQQHQQIKEQLQQIEALRKSVAENSKMKERLATLENLVTNLASANGHLSLSGEKVATAK